MNKIKELFSGMISSVKETINRFPLTTIIVFILTFTITFLVIGANFSKDIEELILHIILIAGFTAVGTWLSEAIFGDKKDKRQIAGYAISFLIAILIDRTIKNDWIEETILARWVCEYVIACFLGTVYTLIKKLDINFEKYILNLILNIKRTSIIFSIISVGFLILYTIFTVLILNSLKFDIVLKIICLFAGFYYIPNIMNAFTNKEAEDTKFNKIVFSKVLLPLIVLAIAIVYIYIAKIFLITEVPKNELFTILSMIFVFAFPVYIVNKNYTEENTLIYKINKAIPYLYIPFILLQMYSMGIRISEYGVTISRYMAIALIVFEIGAIMLAVIKKGIKLKEIIIYAVALSIVIFITPINYDTISKMSQKSIVDKYVANGTSFDELDQKDKKKFSGAYKYIKNDEKYVNSALTQEEKEKLLSYNTYRYLNNNETKKEEKNIYVNLNKSIDSLNITNYSKIYEIPHTYGHKCTVKYSRIGNIYSYGNEYSTDLEFSVNLEEYIGKLIQAYETSKETSDRVFKEMQVIKVDENRDLYLTRLSFNYDKKSKDKENISIKGYLLEK